MTIRVPAAHDNSSVHERRPGDVPESRLLVIATDCSNSAWPVGPLIIRFEIAHEHDGGDSSSSGGGDNGGGDSSGGGDVATTATKRRLRLRLRQRRRRRRW